MEDHEDSNQDDRDVEDAALREAQEGKGYGAGGPEREETRDKLEEDDDAAEEEDEEVEETPTRRMQAPSKKR